MTSIHHKPICEVAGPTSSDVDVLPIAETFSSIQGEGGLMGTPSYFIRVSGCNLRCSWCDTPYASWKPEGDKRTVDSIVDEARASGLKHVVITGGEPMIFPTIQSLTQKLHSSISQINTTIETAGTVFQSVHCDLMSISPKLANSTPKGEFKERHERYRLNIPVLQQLIDSNPSRQFKFVITSEKDIVEIDILLSQLKNWNDDDIFLMPEGITLPTTERKQLVTDLCMKRGWRYAHRLHIELFGNKRGT